ncbi:hypothetical protein D3C85_1129530 [compost metagenome]
MLISKVPSKSEITELLVCFSSTDTPGIGTLLISLIVPFIFCWENEVQTTNRKSIVETTFF